MEEVVGTETMEEASLAFMVTQTHDDPKRESNTHALESLEASTRSRVYPNGGTSNLASHRMYAIAVRQQALQ